MPVRYHTKAIRLRALAVAALSVPLIPASAGAATYSWLGTTGIPAWNAVAGGVTNWAGNVLPASAASTDLVFVGGGAPNQNLGNPFQLNTLTFAAGAGSFNLVGNPLQLNKDNVTPTITQASASGQVISEALILAGDLDIAGSGTGALLFVGPISETGAARSLTQSGSFTTTLLAGNSYAGGTTVNAGILRLGINSAIGTGPLTVGGGTFDLNKFSQTVPSLSFTDNAAPGTPSITGTGTLTLTGDIQGTDNGTLPAPPLISANLSLSSGTHTFQVTRPNFASGFYDLVIPGTISGGGGFKVGSGARAVFSGANTYAGATQVAGGTLYLGATNTLPISGDISLAGGALSLSVKDAPGVAGGDYNQQIGSLSGALGTVDLGSATLTTGGNGASTTFGGAISGTGRLVKVGTGTFTLSHPDNTYAGGTTVKAGTLRAGAANTLGPGDLTVVDGAVDLNGFDQHLGTIIFGDGVSAGNPTITGGGTVTLDGSVELNLPTTQSATLPVNINLPAGVHEIIPGDGSVPSLGYGLVISGVLSGAGGLRNSSGLHVALTNQNTYAGTTDGFLGTLFLAATNAVDSQSAVQVSGSLVLNPTFAQAGVTPGSYDQNIGSLSGSGNVSLGSATLTVGNDNTSTTFSGNISGLGGSLVKVGTGTLTLSGNVGYIGSTTISNGTLSVKSIGGGPYVLGSDATPGRLRYTGNSANIQLTVFATGGSSGGTLENASAGQSLVLGGNTIGGLIDTGGNPFGLDGTGDFFVRDAIIGGGNFTKSGAGSLTLMGAADVGNLTVNGGATTVTSAATISASGSLGITTGASLTLDGGTLAAASMFSLGTFNFIGGTLSLTNSSLAIGASGPLGGAVVLGVPHRLLVSGTTTIDSLSSLTLDGGLLATGDLAVDGAFHFNSGTLRITGTNLVVGSSGQLGSTLTLSPGQHVEVSGGGNSLTVDPSALLYLPGGTVSAAGIVNNGTIQLASPVASISGGTFTNNHLLRGIGIVGNPVSNAAGAEIRAQAGDDLTFNGAVTNDGRINLTGGSISFTAPAINDAAGNLTGRGEIHAGAGLTNSGRMNLSGGFTDFYGPLTNADGAQIIISGNGTTTFYDDVTHNAGANIQVSTGASVVFFGSVDGAGTFSGDGAKFFEGGTSALGAIATPGTTTVQPGAALAATQIRERSLVVNGPVTLLPGGGPAGTSILGALAIDPAAWLDLGNNDLVLLSSSGLGYDDLRQWINQGLITTTALSPTPGHPAALAPVSNALLHELAWNGQTISDGSDFGQLMVRYTYAGDTNLDGTVTQADYRNILANMGRTDATWLEGDLNLDGAVTLADFALVIQNLGAGTGGLSGPPLGALAADAPASVPEPAGLLLLPIAGLALARRRRTVN